MRKSTIGACAALAMMAGAAQAEPAADFLEWSDAITLPTTAYGITIDSFVEDIEVTDGHLYVVARLFGNAGTVILRAPLLSGVSLSSLVWEDVARIRNGTATLANTAGVNLQPFPDGLHVGVVIGEDNPRTPNTDYDVVSVSDLTGSSATEDLASGGFVVFPNGRTEMLPNFPQIFAPDGTELRPFQRFSDAAVGSSQGGCCSCML